jgi:uncharacterized membrane protein YbhN (UPF0104 family)
MTPVAAVGLGLLTCGTAGFYLLQRFRLASTVTRWLHGTGRFSGLERFLEGMHAFDDQLAAFYIGQKRRLAGALLLGFASWLIGIVEILILMYAIGHPVTLTQAWVIESLAQLVRAAAFFIPAAIGVQEGTFLIVLGALTGSGAVGVAVAVVRRFRQLLWLAIGVAMSWLLAMRPRPAAMVVSEEARS